MTPAEGLGTGRCAEPVQPVPGKFRDNDGIHQRGNDSNEGDVQRSYNMDPSPCFLLRLRTKQDSAAELTLQTVEAVFKATRNAK